MANVLSAANAESPDPVSLLFQSGYLTIKEKNIFPAEMHTYWIFPMMKYATASSIVCWKCT